MYNIEITGNPARVYFTAKDDSKRERFEAITALVEQTKNLDSFYLIYINEDDPFKDLNEVKAFFPTEEAFNQSIEMYRGFYMKIIKLMAVRSFEKDKDHISANPEIPRENINENYWVKTDPKEYATYKLEVAEELVRKHIAGEID